MSAMSPHISLTVHQSTYLNKTALKHISSGLFLYHHASIQYSVHLFLPLDMRLVLTAHILPHTIIKISTLPTPAHDLMQNYPA
jgi:hypothetical protein